MLIVIFSTSIILSAKERSILIASLEADNKSDYKIRSNIVFITGLAGSWFGIFFAH